MWARVLRGVDLRPGEGQLVGRAAGVLFLVIAAHTLLETARDALFLEKLPANRLGLVYAAMAILSLLAVRITERFVFRFGRRNAFIISLMGVSYFSTMLYLAPLETASIYVLYLFTGVAGTLLTLQFWLLSGSLFTVAQGKRLFGPLAAGGVLGAVTGASSAMLILQFVSVRELIVFAGGLFLLGATLLTTIPLEDTQRKREPGTPREPTVRWDAFRAEPYVRRLAGFIIAVTAAVLLADYVFKWSAAALVPKDQLGSFFATYYAALNAASFLVQVVLAGYIVRKLGVASAVLVLPLLVAVGGTAVVLLGGSFLAVLLTKGVDGSLRHSLHRVSTELLWMPLAPQMRESAKSMVDSVLVRLTQAASAGFILLVATFGREDPRIYAGLVALLAGLALALGYSLRRPYLDLFRVALGSRSRARLDLELDLRSVEIAVEALSSRDPARVLATIELLEHKGRHRLIPSLILYHDSEEVLIRALQAIAVPERKDWIPLTERLLSNESGEVRTAAVRALARAGVWSESLEARMRDISPAVRAHATYWRLERSEGAVDPERDEHVKRLLEMQGPAGVLARTALFEAVADGSNPRWTRVLLQLDWSANLGELESAALAVQKMPDPRFIPLLVPRLAVRAGRAAIRGAIETHGENGQKTLEAVFLDPTTDPKIRLHIPRSLAWFRNQRAADFLSEHLEVESDRRVAYKLLRSLERMAGQTQVQVDPGRMESELQRNLVRYFEVLALKNALTREQDTLDERSRKSGKLLLDLLDDKLRQALQRAFMVLKTLHRREELRPVLAALESKNARVRAQAAELVDGLLQGTRTEAGAVSRELFRVVADDLGDEERFTRVRNRVPAGPTSAAEALLVLMSDPREPQAALAVHHVFNLDAPGLREDARRMAKERPGLMTEVVDDWDVTNRRREARRAR